jgi:hypothetical protein
MAINLVKLNTKLQAIITKDIDKIMAEMPYLPRLGNTYNRNQVTAWLNKVAKVLQDASGYTDAQVETFRLNTYNALSAGDKLIADAMYAGQNYSLDSASSDANYDRLVALVLIKFITE